jgi:hypothetical protein
MVQSENMLTQCSNIALPELVGDNINSVRS